MSRKKNLEINYTVVNIPLPCSLPFIKILIISHQDLKLVNKVFQTLPILPVQSQVYKP